MTRSDGTDRDELIAFHAEAAAATADRAECASHVIGLGELGLAPRAFLDDPRLAVRVCAALAPALAADSTAVDVLVRAAEHPRAFDHSFTEPFADPAYPLVIPPQFQDRPHRVLIRAVCERVSESPRLFGAALAAMELRDTHQPKPEFGPYLRVAFPAGLTDNATASHHQQAFARAIADRDDLWDDTYLGVADVFAAAGLPYDRERWRNVRASDRREAEGRPTHDSATIVVITAARAIRKRPAMYLGVARTSPDLLRNLLHVVATDAVTVRAEAPLRFAVEAGGTTLPLSAVESIATAQALGSPAYFGLSVAAALSLRVSVWLWVDSVAYRQQFVDHVPMAPIQTLGPADREDGYRIVYELDRDWLPPGAQLPEQEARRDPASTSDRNGWHGPHVRVLRGRE